MDGKRLNGESMSEQRNGRSVAIWGVAQKISEGTNQKASLNVHFNYWHVRSQKAEANSASDFLDIGIMASNPTQLSHLCVYVPFKVTITEFEDLGPLFAKPIVASIIFNESLKATSSYNANYVELQNSKGDLHSRVYQFTKGSDGAPTQNELTLTSEASGTIINICQPALQNGSTGLSSGKDLYFRIRLRVAEKQGVHFVRTIKPVDAWLLSSFNNTEFLDFRLNEVRNLPRSVLQKMLLGSGSGEKAPEISRVDFLVIVGEAAEVADGVECNKKRLLENELWDTYTKSKLGCTDSLPDGMVIYHWKKVAQNSLDIGDFSAFIKLKLRRSGLSLVCRYLIVIAIIGFLGSLIASVVWTKFGMEEWLKPAKPSIETPKS
jgi:hypothetical protein